LFGGVGDIEIEDKNREEAPSGAGKFTPSGAWKFTPSEALAMYKHGKRRPG
jgi:hypothetical protein